MQNITKPVPKFKGRNAAISFGLADRERPSRKGFTKIPNALIDSKLRPMTKLVLCAALSHCYGDATELSVNQSELARNLCLDRKIVRTAVADLKRLGILQAITAGRQGTRERCSIHLDRLETWGDVPQPPAAGVSPGAHGDQPPPTWGNAPQQHEDQCPNIQDKLKQLQENTTDNDAGGVENSDDSENAEPSSSAASKLLALGISKDVVAHAEPEVLESWAACDPDRDLNWARNPIGVIVSALREGRRFGVNRRKAKSSDAMERYWAMVPPDQRPALYNDGGSKVDRYLSEVMGIEPPKDAASRFRAMTGTGRARVNDGGEGTDRDEALRREQGLVA